MSAKVAMHMNTSRNNSDKGADVSKGGITLSRDICRKDTVVSRVGTGK